MNPSSHHHSAGMEATSARKTVLVVDDDLDARDVLTLVLEDDGFVVESADDGLSALQKIRATAPDLVLLDLNMPRMGGEAFLHAWRAAAWTTRVPVIVVTATTRALKPDDLGVDSVFTKPFDVDQLLWHVRDLLALPMRLQAGSGLDATGSELAGAVGDLANVMTTLLISAEQLADASNLPADLQAIAKAGLDAAQRASALIRRVNHLMTDQG